MLERAVWAIGRYFTIVKLRSINSLVVTLTPLPDQTTQKDTEQDTRQRLKLWKKILSLW